MKEKWIMREEKKIEDSTYKELGLNPIMGKILSNRGITTSKDIDLFINGSIEDLQDGFMMKDMHLAIDIIKKYVLEKRPILIYGDYDCDGVSSTYILLKGLKECGAQVSYHIPHRENEGYGMNEKRIGELYKEGYEIILTCDNGISAFNEVEYAKSLGMKVVVTDHHDIPFVELEDGRNEEKIPPADAIVNPKQKDCSYPFKNLCGAGIAYKFILCLCKELGIATSRVEDLVEIAAIATVCDVVDLVNENRIIVKEGLKRLNNTKNLGIKSLIKANNLQDKILNEYHLGFVIGPCINATGRLETADLALELLMSDNEKASNELAQRLLTLNRERQEMTNVSLEKVIDIIRDKGYEKDKVLFVYEPSIHESLAGIVAGRIRERYNAPAIVMTSGKEMPKGSGRSIEKYNMHKELTKCSDLIEKFGGHPMAAGLSVREENLPKLREALINNCELTEEDMLTEIRIDMHLPFRNLNYGLIEEIEALAPFGKGNPKPLFGEKDVYLKRIWFIGNERNSIRVSFSFDNTTINGIAFNIGEEFRKLLNKHFGEVKALEIETSSYCNIKCALVYYPSINEYNGNKTIQAKIESLRFIK